TSDTGARGVARVAPALDRTAAVAEALRLGGMARHDFLDGHAVRRLEADASALLPHHACDDDMLATAKLYDAVAWRHSGRQDHQSARGNVKDAGVAPPRARSKARGQCDAAAEFP